MGDKDCDAIAAQSHGLTSKDDDDSHIKQPLNILATLKRIAHLKLTAPKTELLRNSIFHMLSQVNYERECGASLILALREYFDAKCNTFKFNSDTSLKLCSKEAAVVLGMEDRGKDFNPFHYRSYFPRFLVEQNGGSEKILTKFTDSDNELQFRKLLIFFFIDQFLFALSNKHPRCSLWGIVEDLDEAESINWPKATLQFIYEELAKLDVEKALSNGQTVGAAFPVLKVMVFERISVLQPSLHTSVAPLLQKYNTDKLKLKDWRQKLRELMPENISPCEFCDKDVNEGVGEAVKEGFGEAVDDRLTKTPRII
ncbi:hypothetical protein RND81_08G139000 [Saponaria officinalis]|uniref:Uncharacterized protein n=1 Tax=Saponaria officinalis TaxID=3572 RepID=A0AAW1J787_SAPOF